MGEKVTIQKQVEAWQWNGEESDLPGGFHVCQPEVHYALGRKYVYFTYADLPCHHWITFDRLKEKPDTPFMGVVVETTLKDGSLYYRQVLPFMCWSIKSEASAQGDYRAKFLNREDEAEVEAFLDFAQLEKWAETKDGILSLPARLEYRQIDGACGRGYHPYYMKQGDWLVKDDGRLSVMPDDHFRLVREESAKRSNKTT